MSVVVTTGESDQNVKFDVDAPFFAELLEASKKLLPNQQVRWVGGSQNIAALFRVYGGAVRVVDAFKPEVDHFKPPSLSRVSFYTAQNKIDGEFDVPSAPSEAFRKWIYLVALAAERLGSGRIIFFGGYCSYSGGWRLTLYLGSMPRDFVGDEAVEHLRTSARHYPAQARFYEALVPLFQSRAATLGLQITAVVDANAQGRDAESMIDAIVPFLVPKSSV